MAWMDKLVAAKGLAKHWPAVQRLFREQVVPTALRAAQNDLVFAGFCRGVYKALPRPVRLLVSSEQFLTFCRQHRDRLLEGPAPEPGGEGSARLPAPNPASGPAHLAGEALYSFAAADQGRLADELAAALGVSLYPHRSPTLGPWYSSEDLAGALRTLREGRATAEVEGTLTLTFL